MKKLLVAITLVCAGCQAPAPPEGTPEAAEGSAATAPEPVDPMAEVEAVLAGDDHDARLAAVRELAESASPDAMRLLISALDDEDFRVRRDAAGALAFYGPAADSAVPGLTALLSDYYAIVRERAVVTLTEIDTDAALDALRAYARDVDLDSIDQALDALGAVGDPRAIPEILPHAESEDLYVRRAAQRALVRIGPEAHDAIEGLTRHADAGVRCTASRSLGVVGTEADRGTLQTLIANDPDPVVQVCARGGLGRLGDGEVIDALAADLAATRPYELREAAIESLAVIGSQASINRIVDALPLFEDAEGVVPNQAMHALIALGDAARTTAGVRIATSHGELTRLLAQVLAVIGTTNDIPALRQAAASAQAPIVVAALEDAVASIELREAAESGRE